MKEKFGSLPNGIEASLFTIQGGGLKAVISDYGATLVSLYVPDRAGNLADVVLGYDTVEGYAQGSVYLGATVGRSANRIAGSQFQLGGKTFRLNANEGDNNLHSGPDYYHNRLWTVEEVDERHIRLGLDSPDGDQGFPGNAHISVTFAIDAQTATLRVLFDGLCDQDTIFNMTNHSYFNLAGHDHPQRAMEQTLMIPAEAFCPADAASIPTGEVRQVAGTPMDFRAPKPIGQDLHVEYEPLKLQGGYDHNFCAGGAVLKDPVSGRTLTLTSNCPGIQFYSGNFLDAMGKGGLHYGKHSAVALEPQFYPDSIHHADWIQPVTRAGEAYHGEICYQFSV